MNCPVAIDPSRAAIKLQGDVTGAGAVSRPNRATKAVVAVVSRRNCLIQIGKTDDPKGIAELQARIGTEQSVLQNAMLQAQLGQQLAEAENKLILQQRAEIAHKAYSAGGALDTQPMNYQH